jgi:hypothetical protein
MLDIVSSEPSLGPVYLYGIFARPSSPLTLPLGLAEPTQLIAVQKIAALVETGIDLEALQADEHRLLNAVLSHDRVICELFQYTPVLPLRFGTQIASLAHLKEHLLSQGAIYEAKLAALDDRAEFQIKLVAQAIELPPLATGLSGRDYFLAKKQRLHDQTAAQEQQQQELGQLLEQIRSSYPDCLEAEGPAGEAKLYLLSDRTAQNDLEQQVDRWRAQATHWAIALSAPLPPYHFV